MLLPYLLCKRASDNRKAKEFGLSQQDISCSSNHVTLTINPSFNPPPFFSSALSLTNFSFLLIVGVRPPTLDSFIDNESVHFKSSDIVPVFEIALSDSDSPPPATIEFWNADAARRFLFALYEPIPPSPNVLPFHNNMTCSADDKPTPNTVSALLPIVEVFYTPSQSSSAALLPIF